MKGSKSHDIYDILVIAYIIPIVIVMFNNLIRHNMAWFWIEAVISLLLIFVDSVKCYKRGWW